MLVTVLGVLGALVVLFAATLVAVRDEPLLADAPPDRRDPGLPPVGPVTAEDLEQVRFGMVVRGYRMSEVDAVLDRLAAELRERDERLAALQDQLSSARDASWSGAAAHAASGQEPHSAPGREPPAAPGRGPQSAPGQEPRPAPGG